VDDEVARRLPRTRRLADEVDLVPSDRVLRHPIESSDAKAGYARGDSVLPVSTPTFAVLGLGEAGGRIAADLAAAGAEVRGYDPVATAPDGVTPADDPAAAVHGADAVLCVASASAARHALDEALPALGAGTVYADLNTAGPALKRELAGLVARFADVALLAPVPARGLRTPALASGPGAEAFAELLGPLGMPVDVVSARPGDAAALKLLRSVFMKGLAAAALESLEAATAAGQREWLERELADVIGADLLARLVEGSSRHAARRVEEMDAACELLVSLGVEPRIAAASRELLTALAVKTAPGRPA
jgi:3-hydroxyisobutyrate dehydrogenase-like beta-hydroxyacid dehydrogenase